MKIKNFLFCGIILCIGIILGGYIGYNKGESAGIKSGYDKGYLDGEAAGFEVGLSNGEIVGYEKGYEEANKKVVEIQNKNYTNQEAYRLGWSFWFSDYGTRGEGISYMPYYIYGRDYKQTFETKEEAFEAGFKDAFYYVNNEDPDDFYNARIARGLSDYIG